MCDEFVLVEWDESEELDFLPTWATERQRNDEWFIRFWKNLHRNSEEIKRWPEWKRKLDVGRPQGNQNG